MIRLSEWTHKSEMLRQSGDTDEAGSGSEPLTEQSSSSPVL